jgi:hypothetical protein
MKGNLYDKFIAAIELDDIKVASPGGWTSVIGIGLTKLFDEYIIEAETVSLKCADLHKVYKCINIEWDKQKYDLEEVFAKDLKRGDYIATSLGPERVLLIEETGLKTEMYDLQLEDGDRLYYTNNILSHNSVWMNNITANAAANGFNVAYITLEMSERKVMKRLGSMQLKIPISEYDQVSKNRAIIKAKIGQLKGNSTTDIFSANQGKIFVKEFPIGTATVADLDAYVKALQEQKRLTLNMIVVDYLSIMGVDRGANDTLYLKGKHLAEGLRSIGQKYNLAVVTAVQVAKEKFDSNEIDLSGVPESKAIAEAADSFWGIIRTPAMKQASKYRLRPLKLRDADFGMEEITFDFDKRYLIINNDRIE